MGDRFLSESSKKNLFVIPDLIGILNLKDGKQLSGGIPTFVGMTAFVEMKVRCHSRLDRESYNNVGVVNKRKEDNNYLHTAYCQLHSS